MSHPKTELNERLRTLGLDRATFATKSRGPDHDRIFAARVVTGEEMLGSGEGKTKREAERRAAEQALLSLELQGSERPTEEDTGFEGPWPIFEAVLATALRIAHERTDPKALGMAGTNTVRDLALALYKDLLEELGEIIEVTEEHRT